MSEQPILEFEQDGPITVARITAASVLDAVNVSQLGADVLAYVKEHPKVKLLLDFDQVDYLSSAVLTELLRINKAVAESKGHFRLCSLNRDIRKVFEITNLDNLFTIYADCPGGVAKFKRSLDIEAQDAAWGDV